jgi:hypothetical protein
MLESTPQATEQRIREVRRQQLEEVRTILEQFSLARGGRSAAVEEERSRLEMEAKNRALWEKIEQSIQETEMAARRAREEEEARVRKAREEEEARIRREQEEAEAKARKAAQEAMEKKREEEEEKKRLEEETQRKQQEAERKAQESEAKKNAPMTREEEYELAVDTLSKIKSEIMPMVKKTKIKPDVEPNPEWRQKWARARRQMVMKVGQVTNVVAEVEHQRYP